MELHPIDTPPPRPLASVVIPTFNRKELLAEAVESALAQDCGNVEVIVVDDGSTDGTEALVAEKREGEWKGRDVKFLRQANAGASAARNAGLAAARGEFIQFLDSDDLLFPSKISTQTALLARPENAKAPFCSCHGVMGPSLEKAVRIGAPGRTPREFLLAMASRQVHAMQTSAPLWRRDFLIRQEGWRTDLAFGDDLEFNARMVCRCVRSAFSTEELFFVREHEASRLSEIGMSVRQVESALKTKELLAESLRVSGNWDAVMQKAFVGALRGNYAVALSHAESTRLAAFERFYLVCAARPLPRLAPFLLVAFRRCLGRRFLLSAHAFLKK